MNRESLTFVADALLALCERDNERPFYGEQTMLSKMRRAEMREPLYGHLLRPLSPDPLLREECDEVLQRANLTERQHEVLLKRLEGWTFEEIGKCGGHSKQGAQSIFIQGLKKLTKSLSLYPFKGLSDVYRQETRRGLRHRVLVK